MSGFSDMMMDDGFSDPMDYMDYLENECLDKLCNDAWEDEYDEQMREQGYVFIGGGYYHEDYIEELHEAGYNIVNGNVVKVFYDENSKSI